MSPSVHRNGTQKSADEESTAPVRVVLIESEAANLSTLRQVIGDLPDMIVAGEAASADEGYREVMKVRPDVVITELSVDDSGAEALAMAERLIDIYPDTALIGSSASQNADVVKRAMRAGVREFLSRPIEATELQAGLRKLLRQRAQATSKRSKTGEIIVVFAPKGGAGATFLATNLAVVLAERGAGSTTLVDLNLHMGDIATFLNIKPQTSIVDVVDASDSVDAAALDSALIEHASGLKILTEPPAAEDAERIEPRHIGQLLIRLKTQYQHVVVDLPHRFDSHALEAIDLADHIVVLTLLEVPAIRNTRRCLDVFAKLGCDDERLKLVVNRQMGRKDADRFEKSLGHPVFWRLPDDYTSAIAAINAGVPVSSVAPSSELAVSLRGFAGRLTGQNFLNRAPQEERGGRLGILRRLLPA